TPLSFALDPDQIRQALGNLILNAIQGSPRESMIKVKVETGRRGVAIDITDHGTGMAAEELERVFEPYYTTRADGSGLGLPIALRIVEDHGGSLQMESLTGRGTTARVFLPWSR
ncbi:MAG TPA: hypothetical protein DCZ69_09215, partial [Syntrophobacteraceae bacterium]|nr:hypothetical protein [Syntrophobacteraceae bacterium]